MSEHLDSLQIELEQISSRIHLLKEQLATADDPAGTRKFQQELKQLQYQALFYIDKINNLK